MPYSYSSIEERALRVALDFQFNVFLYLLIIAIFILLIVIAFKLGQINDALSEIRKWKDAAPQPKAPQSQEASSNDQESQLGFTIGQLVIRIKDEKQFRVHSFTPEGTIIGTTGVYKVELQPSEIADFEAYWAEKKGEKI